MIMRDKRMVDANMYAQISHIQVIRFLNFLMGVVLIGFRRGILSERTCEKTNLVRRVSWNHDEVIWIHRELRHFLDLEISLGDLDDGFDHGDGAIDKVTHLYAIVFVKAAIDDQRELGASQDDLGAVLLLLEFLEQDDEFFDDLFTLVASFDRVDNILQKILVLLGGDDWLDAASLEARLEKTSVDAATTAENTAPPREVRL